MASIQSLADLKAEKAKVAEEIKMSGQRLESLVTDIPGRLLGSTLGMVAGAVVKGIQNHWQDREEQKEKEYREPDVDKNPESFGKTLQSVGEETAYFALAKLVEKLLSRE